MGWNDPVKMQIVQRIQKNTVNQISGHLKKSEQVNVDATASKLAGRLGRNLLPRVGYGKKPGGSGGSGGSGGGGTKINNIVLEISSQTIHGNSLVMNYELQLMHGKKDAKVSLMIASEGGWIDPVSWKDEIGTEFPAVFDSVSVDTIKTSVSENTGINQTFGVEAKTLSVEEAEFTLQALEGVSQCTTLVIHSNVLNPQIAGSFVVKTHDKKYQFAFKLE